MARRSTVCIVNPKPQEAQAHMMAVMNIISLNSFNLGNSPEIRDVVLVKLSFALLGKASFEIIFPYLLITCNKPSLLYLTWVSAHLYQHWTKVRPVIILFFKNNVKKITKYNLNPGM